MQAPLSCTASPHTGPTRATDPHLATELKLPISSPSSSPQEQSRHFRTAPPPLSATPATIAGREGLLHDVRNLIGATRLYCELLCQPGVLNEEHGHIAKDLRHLSDRTHSLVEQWLEAEPRPIASPGTVEPASLAELAGRCSGIVSELAGEYPIYWEIGDAAALPVDLSCEDMERILVNLVQNAVAALDRPGRISDDAASIRIAIGQGDPALPSAAVSLTVHDTGCGMYAGRLVSSATNPRGHGMGLRIVRELAAAAGGTVSIATRLGAGTSVRLDLPAATHEGLLTSVAPMADPCSYFEASGSPETSRPC
jgi:signal transduction histidine kinase